VRINYEKKIVLLVAEKTPLGIETEEYILIFIKKYGE